MPLHVQLPPFACRAVTRWIRGDPRRRTALSQAHFLSSRSRSRLPGSLPYTDRRNRMAAGALQTDFAIGSTSDGHCAGRRDAAVDCTYDPGAPGWRSSSFAGTLRCMGLRRDAPRDRCTFCIRKWLRLGTSAARGGPCRSAEAVPCRGGNAGHLEMAVPSFPKKLPDIIFEPPAEISRSPRIRPLPDIQGIPTDNQHRLEWWTSPGPTLRGALSRAASLGE